MHASPVHEQKVKKKYQCYESFVCDRFSRGGGGEEEEEEEGIGEKRPDVVSKKYRYSPTPVIRTSVIRNLGYPNTVPNAESVSKKSYLH